MVIARRLLVQEETPGCYHLISRCVRRLRCLAGTDRKDWVERCIRQHARSMAIDILTYAVMKNHLHVIIRIRPDIAATWSTNEVVNKWLELVPIRDCYGEPIELDKRNKQHLSENRSYVEERRRRLSSMSWLMRLVKQKISRRMNKADEVSGHFWDERFLSIPLPDKRAIFTCMAYVDLNPFRAEECTLPEQARYTGLHVRLQCTQQNIVETLSTATWLVPITDCDTLIYHQSMPPDSHSRSPQSDRTEKWYFQFIDSVAREIKFDEQGRKKARLPRSIDHIFERLGM